MDEQEFERDEQLLEARRLKRARTAPPAQGAAAHCSRRAAGDSDFVDGSDCPRLQEPQRAAGAVRRDGGCTAECAGIVVPTEPDTTVTIAAVGDIMMYDEQLDAARQDDGTYDFTSSFAAVSGSTVSADLTVGNLELNFCGEPYSGKPDFRAPESLAKTLSSIGFDVLQTANTYSIQNGLSGLQSTIRYLDAAGLSHVGTYAGAGR